MLKNFFEIDYVMYKQLSNIKKKNITCISF